MFKKLNKKGFTLAELLVVVAIIGVLVAISIPIFSAQLNKAKYATDLANARSIYAELQADYLVNGQQKLTVPGKVEASGASQQITITEQDGSANTYKFSGIVEVDFTAGTSTTQPKVEVKKCDKTGDEAVTFGGNAAGKTTP
ncbi:type IV pilin protein [Oribacterium sp. Sow4_G1_1]|uniref:type IV pilin protein n=1 Tax=Oribacterium sp. Sow4_G1_1 TaxID=3438794 RepID=UPI003F9915EF